MSEYTEESPCPDCKWPADKGGGCYCWTCPTCKHSNGCMPKGKYAFQRANINFNQYVGVSQPIDMKNVSRIVMVPSEKAIGGISKIERQKLFENSFKDLCSYYGLEYWIEEKVGYGTD